MIKRTLLAAAIFSALPAYAGLTSITAGYDFTDYSGDHGNRNLAYAELVAKVENATLLFNLSQAHSSFFLSCSLKHTTLHQIFSSHHFHFKLPRKNLLQSLKLGSPRFPKTCSG